MYCKVVERGEAATLPQLGAERWPDELTLLARSFQAMHARLAEQIGSDPLTGCMNRHGGGLITITMHFVSRARKFA